MQQSLFEHINWGVMVLSYIVGHRGDGERLENLLFTIKYISQIDLIDEIIIVEQSNSDSVLSKLNLPQKCKHIFLSHSFNWFYNRSWGFNVGYRHSLGDYLIFSDNDIFMNLEDLTSSLKDCKNYDAVNPYSKIIDTTSSEAKAIIETGIANVTNRSSRGGVNFAGGMCMFSRSAFEQIGGWDERFVGWGGEDEALCHKISKILQKDRYKTLDFTSFHLYHARSHMIKKGHNRSYRKGLLSWYRSASKDMILKSFDINDIGQKEYQKFQFPLS